MAIAITWPGLTGTRSPGAAREGIAVAGSRSRFRIGLLAIISTAVVILGVAAWLVASAVLGLSAFALTTSSMAPAIPIGSLAIVQHVAADEIAVGDVVTVPRTVNAPPVTQRVIAIDSAGGGSTELTIRGDAYEGAGVGYAVTTVDRVIATVPHAGEWLRTVLRPIVLAPLTALIVVASMWVLWPERPQAPTRHRARHAAVRG